ncbi:MAG: hypothetical protein ACPG19_08625 [Saprospiraceae bacterium]
MTLINPNSANTTQTTDYQQFETNLNNKNTILPYATLSLFHPKTGKTIP